MESLLNYVKNYLIYEIFKLCCISVCKQVKIKTKDKIRVLQGSIKELKLTWNPDPETTISLKEKDLKREYEEGVVGDW